MGIQIASLYAKIGADTSAFERAMSGVDGKLGTVGGAFGKLGDVIKGVFTVGAGVAAAGIAGLTAEIAKSTSSAADMEQRVADIAAAMNLTSEQTSKVSKLISDLGLDPNLKVSATEAADVIQKLGTAGLSLDTILGGAARSTVQLANATGADFSQAASIASDSMSIFGLKASDLDKSISSILATTQASKFEIGDYAEALAQGGGVAAAVGVSFDDFNTTIAAISPLFASGSDAGTSYKTFLQRLVPQSNEAVDAMRDLGLFTGATKKEFQDAQDKLAKVKDQISKLDPTSKNYAKRLAELQAQQAKWNSVINNGKNAFFDANGNLKSMSQIAGLLQKALSGLSEEQKNSALSTIFGSDAMRAAVAIAQQGEAGFNSLAATMAKTDVGDAMATRMNTFNGAWEIFKGVIESLQITIGNNFLPVFKDMVTWTTNFASANVEPINNFFAGLAGRLAEVWIAFKQGGLAGAFADLQKQIGQMYEALMTWLNQTGILNQIQTTLAGWSGAFANWAIGLWGTYVMPKLTEFWNGLTSWITDDTKRGILLTNLANWGQQFAGWAGGLWNDHIWPKLVETWTNLITWISDEKNQKAMFDTLAGWGRQFAGWAGELWNTHIKPKIDETWTSLTTWITDEKRQKELLDKLAGWGRQFAGWAGGLWNDHIKPSLEGWWTTFAGKGGWIETNAPELQPWIDKITGAFNTLKTQVGLSIDGFKEAWPQMKSSVKDAADRIGEDIDRIMTSLGRIANWFNGTGGGANVHTNWAQFWARTVAVLATAETQVFDLAANVLESFNLLLEGMGALGAGDTAKLADILKQVNTLASQRDVFGRIKAIWDAATGDLTPQTVNDRPARAAGGPVTAGQSYIVGETGMETFTPSSNGYIWNAADTARMWGGERTLRVVVESPLPTNRQAIRELALALKREIDLTGAVMVG